MPQNKIFRAVFLAYSSLFLLGLADNIRGPLFPEILRDFHLTDTKGSLFFALSSLCGFFGGLASHRLLPRWGVLASLRFSIVLMGVGELVMSQASSFAFLLLGVLFFGASMGLMGVVQNLLIMQAVPAGPLKARLFSGLHGTYALASLASPLLVTGIAQQNWSGPLWKTNFLGLALLCGVMGAATWAGSPLPIEEILETPSKGRQTMTSQARPLYFALILAAYVLVEILVSSRLALFLRRERGADLIAANLFTAGFFVSLLLGRVLFALWTPRLNLRWQLSISLVLTALSLLGGMFGHPMGLALSGFFMGPFYPLMMVYAEKIFAERVGAVVAWGVALSSLLIVLMNFAVGRIADVWSLQAAFGLGPVFCGLALGMLIFDEKIFCQLQS